MTQADKDLLLKDLCARLPYGVKAVLTRTNCNDFINKVSEKDLYSFRTGRPLEEDYGQHDYYKVVVTDIKPYLFPLSNMTDEQRKEWQSLMIKDSYGILYYTVESYDYLYKNHIDIRGFISMGLALDATGLNIY